MVLMSAPPDTEWVGDGGDRRVIKKERTAYPCDTLKSQRQTERNWWSFAIGLPTSNGGVR